MADDIGLRRLIDEIARRDDAAALALLTDRPALATAALVEGATRAAATSHFLPDLGHYVYAGDTALHLAAAAHRPDMVRALVAAGADIGARNRRGATALHYATDANPASPDWLARLQAETITVLIEGGADPNARDRSGTSPLHRAVRNRCAEAVRALLDGGADGRLTNRAGASPFALTTTQTGKSGSGSPEARAQRAEIVRLLESRGLAR